MIGFAAFLLLASASPTPSYQQSSCAKEIRATRIATRLSDLPDEIPGEMSRLKELFGEHMADSDATVLQTDAPGLAEKGHVEVKFSQAYLVNDTWFVQFEVAMFQGVRTTSFVRQSDGRFEFRPSHYFGGPSCASIKAALSGVTTPLGPMWNGS